MKQRLLFLALGFLSFAVLLLTNPLQAVAATDPIDPACQGEAASSPICREKAPDQNPVYHVIKITTDVFAIIAGVGAMIMILLGAFFLVTSAGSEEGVAKAKKRIVAAVVGLIIIAIAWLAVSFVNDHLIK